VIHSVYRGIYLARSTHPVQEQTARNRPLAGLFMPTGVAIKPRGSRQISSIAWLLAPVNPLQNR
jgi:hypothetical protein